MPIHVKNAFAAFQQNVQECKPELDTEYLHQLYRNMTALMVAAGVTNSKDLANLPDDFTVDDAEYEAKRQELETEGLLDAMLTGVSDRELIHSPMEFKIPDAFQAEPQMQQSEPVVRLQNGDSRTISDTLNAYREEIKNCQPDTDTEYLHTQIRNMVTLMLLIDAKQDAEIKQKEIDANIPSIPEDEYVEAREAMEADIPMNDLLRNFSDQELINAASDPEELLRMYHAQKNLEHEIYNVREHFDKFKAEIPECEPKNSGSAMDSEYIREQYRNMVALYSQLGIQSSDELYQHSDAPDELDYVGVRDTDFIAKRSELDANGVLDGMLAEMSDEQLIAGADNFDAFYRQYQEYQKLLAEVKETEKQAPEAKAQPANDEKKPAAAEAQPKKEEPAFSFSLSAAIAAAQTELIQAAKKIPHKNGESVYPNKNDVIDQYATIITAKYINQKIQNHEIEGITIEDFEKERQNLKNDPYFKHTIHSSNDSLLYLLSVKQSGDELFSRHLSKKQQQMDAELEKAKNALRSEAAGAQKRKDLLTGRFGPNASIIGTDDPNKYFTQEAAAKYNSTKLPVPDDMTPEMVSIIALGNAMDDTRYDFNKKMTESSRPLVELNWTQWNRAFIYMNIIPEDSRSRDFSDLMADSREVTKNALEEYQKGNYAPVQRSIDSFCDLCKQTMLTSQTNSALSTNEKQYYKILTEMDKNPNLRVKEQFSEAQWAKIQSLAAQIESADKFYESSYKLVDQPPEAGSEERKQLAFDMLMNAGIMNCQIPDDPRPMFAIQDNWYKTIGAQLDPPMSPSKFESMLQDHRKATPEQAVVYAKLTVFYPEELTNRVLPAETFSAAEGYLTDPNGKQQLAGFYKDAIEKSDLYKKLVNEKDPMKLTKLIDQAKKNNLDNYTDVKLDDSKAKHFSADKTQSKKVFEEWGKTFQTEFAYSIGPKRLNKDVEALNRRTFNYFRKESDELKDLRAKTEQLSLALKTKGRTALQDPEVMSLIEQTYQASGKYIEAKRKEANVKPENNSWHPVSPDGQAHYNAAKSIREYTAQFVDLEKIRKEAELEEKQREQERLEHNMGKSFKKGSIAEQQLNEAIREVTSAYQDNGSEIAAELYGEAEARKEANEHFEEALSKLIAVRTVGLISEQAAQNGIKIKERDFKRYVTEAANEIRQRDDFKVLMRNNKPGELALAATTANGKTLMMKLADAGKIADKQQEQKENMLKATKTLEKNKNLGSKTMSN